MEYRTTLGILSVLAVGGRDIKGRSMFSITPYVQFQIDHMKKKTKVCKKKGSNPKWNDLVEFEIIKGRDTLQGKVMGKEMSEDEFIGDIKVDLKPVFSKLYMELWTPVIHPHKNRHKGDIYLKLSYKPSPPPQQEFIPPPQPMPMGVRPGMPMPPRPMGGPGPMGPPPPMGPGGPMISPRSMPGAPIPPRGGAPPVPVPQRSATTPAMINPMGNPVVPQRSATAPVLGPRPTQIPPQGPPAPARGMPGPRPNGPPGTPGGLNHGGSRRGPPPPIATPGPKNSPAMAPLPYPKSPMDPGMQGYPHPTRSDSAKDRAGNPYFRNNSQHNDPNSPGRLRHGPSNDDMASHIQSPMRSQSQNNLPPPGGPRSPHSPNLANGKPQLRQLTHSPSANAANGPNQNYSPRIMPPRSPNPGNVKPPSSPNPSNANPVFSQRMMRPPQGPRPHPQ